VELLRLLKADDREIQDCPVTPQGLAGLLKMLETGVISGKMAKDVLEQAYREAKDPVELVKAQGLSQVTDESILRDAVKKVIQANPSEVEKYRAGKTNVLAFFVGQVMKETRGKANPKTVNELLREMLAS